jgi:flagellar basal-body rod modification protein FlgD
MADISITNSSINNLSSQERFKNEPKSNELGQDAFLQLMITQMENQNPLEPQSNSEFVAQLAQFSSVEGLEKLNNSFDSMVGSFQSSQALQASSLVGRKVTVATDYASLVEGGEIKGTIGVPYDAEGVTLNIYDAKGVLVSTDELGGLEAGVQDFTWDGNDDDGDPLKSGSYYIEVIGKYGEDSLQLGTEMQANVDSVTVGANGTLTLNVDGVGPVLLSSVRNIL